MKNHNTMPPDHEYEDGQPSQQQQPDHAAITEPSMRRVPEVKKNASRPVYSVRQPPPARLGSLPAPPEESSTRLRIKQKREERPRGEWLWVFAAGALFSIVLVIGLAALMVLRSANPLTTPTPSNADLHAAISRDPALPTPDLNLSENNGLTTSLSQNVLALPDGSSIHLAPWDGQSRFTVIAVGLDRRTGQTGLAYRTDSMMLISIDPQTQSLGILSIPRDLYVQVPGYSELQRINTALALGENQRPGYGPTLMMQTVQLNLGIAVHDFVAVDFQAFVNFVDALGGISVTIDYAIRDDLYPDMNNGYDPFYLDAGTHTLNGYNALRFARTRHGDSDIQRAERQQQLIRAVQAVILQPDALAGLLLKAPTLWHSLQANVYTGLDLEQIIQLGLYVSDIPADTIRMGVINYDYLRSYTVPSNGAQVLIPDRTRLGDLMIAVFGDTYNT